MTLLRTNKILSVKVRVTQYFIHVRNVVLLKINFILRSQLMIKFYMKQNQDVSNVTLIMKLLTVIKTRIQLKDIKCAKCKSNEH